MGVRCYAKKHAVVNVVKVGTLDVACSILERVGHVHMPRHGGGGTVIKGKRNAVEF